MSRNVPSVQNPHFWPLILHPQGRFVSSGCADSQKKSLFWVIFLMTASGKFCQLFARTDRKMGPRDRPRTPLESSEIKVAPSPCKLHFLHRFKGGAGAGQRTVTGAVSGSWEGLAAAQLVSLFYEQYPQKVHKTSRTASLKKWRFWNRFFLGRFFRNRGFFVYFGRLWPCRRFFKNSRHHMIHQKHDQKNDRKKPLKRQI